MAQQKVKTFTCVEFLLIVTGLLSSTIMGLLFAIFPVIYSEYTSLLIDRNTPNKLSSKTIILELFGGGQVLYNRGDHFPKDAILADTGAYFAGGCVLSFMMFLLGILMCFCLNAAAQKRVRRIRKALLENTLRQETGWFDNFDVGKFPDQVTSNLDKLQEGTGDKMGIFLYNVMTFVFGLIISLLYGWELTLIIGSVSPIIIGAGVIVSLWQAKLMKRETLNYNEAGSVVTEALAAVKTVVAYSGEEVEVKRYEEKLKKGNKFELIVALLSGAGSAVTWPMTYLAFGLFYFFGVEFVIQDINSDNPVYTPAVILIILFEIASGSSNVGTATPHLEAFSKARGAATSVHEIIQRQSLIDSMSPNGKSIGSLQKSIEFKNVTFFYPSRPTIKILDNFNLVIKKGETIAIVGSSGSGKSTIIQLLERFYDPSEGIVSIDGVDLKELNIQGLRSTIGLVGQEPVLFNTTIEENISCYRELPNKDLIEAATEANAHSFISQLPQGYKTVLGEDTQLSGGQKQRIAIARVLTKNPEILLLDEATSALDTDNEKIVQESLEKSAQGRTTIIVSHRLSHIKNVDRIVVLSSGKIIEQGTHDELIKNQGFYYTLATANSSLQEKECKTEIKDNIDIKSNGIVNNNDQAKVEVKKKESNEKMKTKKNGSAWWRIIKLHKPDWVYVLFGGLSALLLGVLAPAGAYIYGDYFEIMSSTDHTYILDKTRLFGYIYIAISVFAAIFIFIQYSFLSIASIRFVTRLRTSVFTAILNQDVGWFDNDDNTVGALSARLSSEASAVQGATGATVGVSLQALSTIGIGIVISFIYSWKMTLVTLVCTPVMLATLFLQTSVMSKEGMTEKEATQGATKVAIEAISNIRTVSSLCLENSFIQRYLKQLLIVEKSLLKKNFIRSFAFSLGNATLLLAYVVSIAFGGYLVAVDGLAYKSVIFVSEALIFGTWLLAAVFAFAPNFGAAQQAAETLFEIIDRKPAIQSPDSSENIKLSGEGEIDYKNVYFHYPTRPEAQILKGINLAISKGKRVALVGTSGCGKSTCVKLLQRFYDVNSGNILMGGANIKSINLKKLRQSFGIVYQEPTLFDRSIAENIAYGDNNKIITMDQIIEAARRANIHSFISSLPAGYNTKVGNKGTQLSGGQKQRIAIARALIKNPQILILDEATSALDAQSEKVVQEALDKAMEGRTSLIIAHRLSTIKDADLICVFDKGVISEMGTHSELLKNDGLYATLIKSQIS